MGPLELLAANLLSPIVLSFALGVAAAWVRSDLKIPDDLYSALSIYLLLAIGMKGGVEISRFAPSQIVWPAIATVALGLGTAILDFGFLRRALRVSAVDAAALAAHYGSVSAVTFIACSQYLEAVTTPAEGFLPALVALLEVPAILIALVLGRSASNGSGEPMGAVIREVLAGRSIVLLVGGLVIGALAGKERFAPVAPLFVDLYRGALVIFLLEMGLTAGRRARELRRIGVGLLVFAVAAPLVHGLLGVGAGRLVGLSVGGCTTLGVLAASASYIAAPAAVRLGLPAANPGVPLTLAIAVTFPFNLALGIPLFHRIALWTAEGPR